MKKKKYGIIGKFIGIFIGIILSPMAFCLGVYYATMFHITKDDKYLLELDNFKSNIENLFTTRGS